VSELNFGRGLYILDESGEKPVPCNDIDAWSNWFVDYKLRKVATTMLGHGTIFVSTVFLGVDHGGLTGPPLLWESMTFKIKDRQIDESIECDRCSGTREQALAMHEAMCAQVEALLSLELELKA
jgi:hypothetical protein